jgi:hypothetical protein
MSRIKRPKAVFAVYAQGKRGKYVAKTAASAVHKFRREFQLTLQTDRETGGWTGVSIDVLGKYNPL